MLSTLDQTLLKECRGTLQQSVIPGYFGAAVIFILHSFRFNRIDGAHFTKPVPTKHKEGKNKAIKCVCMRARENETERDYE